MCAFFPSKYCTSLPSPFCYLVQRKVCNDGRCEEDCSNVTSTSLTTYLETFYNEADGCSERMEEICLLNVLGTFKELYRKMVDDFYFQECMG